MSQFLKQIVLFLVIATASCGVFAESCHITNGPEGCGGVVGLIRVNKHFGFDGIPQDNMIRYASRHLFGDSALPSPGSVLVIKRSARLRKHVFSGDDRIIEREEQACTALKGCDERYVCTAFYVSKEFKESTFCKDGEESLSDYLAAGTLVRILGYQMHAHLFVLVEVLKTETHNPYEDEKKYTFDPLEVI